MNISRDEISTRTRPEKVERRKDQQFKFRSLSHGGENAGRAQRCPSNQVDSLRLLAGIERQRNQGGISLGIER